ncbi:MAG: hybrid sensor histidine kinase/response regulator [Chlorobi bacterium]|nr:hybrid sensor histidine kinase/response regulator [Chlorobiota bacterium]
MTLVQYIRSSFRQGTQISRFNIIAASLIGATGHFMLFFVYKYLLHNKWENLPVRLVGVALCIGVLFKLKNPDFLGKYFVYYWHLMLIYVLPFIITLFLLKNNVEEPWLNWEIFMIFVLMSFVPNFMMFLFDLLVGVVMAFVVFWLLPPAIELSPQFNVFQYSIVAVFSIFAGYVFSLSNIKGIVAQEKNTALQMLAASIAHEMRNPLGQVKFSFEKILHELPVEHQQKIAEYISPESLNRVYQSVAQGKMAVNRGVQIIDMLLNEVKNTSIDTSTFTYCSCVAVTRKALDEYGYESDTGREKLSFEHGEDFVIKVDETLYVFVLFNLIINAFYFIRPLPHARISIRIQRGGKQNRVYVRDTGPGIPPENLCRLFEAFFTSGKKGGTGLGLAYCKRVMRAFGGDIVCDSVQGEYTEFMLTFPEVNDQELAEYRKQTISRHAPIFLDKRILLVDDEFSDREMAIRYLEPFRTAVDEAADGQEAIEMLRRQRYDAVLMNLNMPVLNGYEAAEAIRAGKAGVLSLDMPIIGYTSMPSYIASAKIEKVGMQGLITKPVREFELIHKLASVLSGTPFNGNPAYSGLRVMLVDDTNVMRMSLKWVLEKFDITIIEAASGGGAIAHLRDSGSICDLILMDIQMPGLDGLETTRKIRNDHTIGCRDIPIIGLSGEQDEREIKKALDAGMNDYLQKPVDNLLLMKKIGQWARTGTETSESS